MFETWGTNFWITISNLCKSKSGVDKSVERFAFGQDCETICQVYSIYKNELENFE